MSAQSAASHEVISHDSIQMTGPMCVILPRTEKLFRDFYRALELKSFAWPGGDKSLGKSIWDRKQGELIIAICAKNAFINIHGLVA